MPYISQNFINDLPNQIDIVDLINKRLPLKKMGSDYRAPCPFHGGKNRNFSVSASKQFYHCFKCGESGGVISFVQKFDNLDFVEAIESIANEFGLRIEYDQKTKPVDARLARYRTLMHKVGAFYILQLKASPAKAKAVNYAKIRGISGTIAKRFELGFATPSNQDLLEFFQTDEQAISDLKTLGLVKAGQYGDYDFFRDRLMFPIHNSKGNIIAFGGRAFDSNAKAKYLNSPESPIFSKSRELYGLYHARKYSHSMDYLLVVEGYMDVVALNQAGITRVVAALGTATTPQHLQTLARTTTNIIFCFDGDEAGKSAAWKALKIALPIIKSGLVVKFLFLPDGEDPDSLVQKESAKIFEKRIEKAQPLSQFLFQHLKDEVAFDSIEGKTIFLENAVNLLTTIVYDTYRQQLIEGLALEVNQKVAQIEKIFQQEKQQQKKEIPFLDALEKDRPPFFSDEVPMPDLHDFADFSADYPLSEAVQKPAQYNNSLVNQMMALLLNCPSMVDETIELRIKKIKDASMLHELTNSALLDEEISVEAMIKPFPEQRQHLLSLHEKKQVLKDYDYKTEFLSALLKAEQQQKRTQDLLITNEAEYAKNLQARKGMKN